MSASVDLTRAIKVTPTARKPYKHLKGQIGGEDATHWEYVTLDRCIAIITEGFPISKLEEDGNKTPLTVENILNPESGVLLASVEGRLVKDGKLVEEEPAVAKEAAVTEQAEAPVTKKEKK